MKKILFISAFAIPLFTFGQQMNSFVAAPGKFKNLNENFEAPLRETVFWEEEFADGIPANWLNGELGGVAYWEYRGPVTDPTNEIGTRGSCLPEGSVGGAPVASESWSNGFVIFDSNWWDDPIGPCGNLGSGPAPAPHDAWLELPSFDFTDHPQPGLIFTQYAKYYQGTMGVEVSVNQAPWVEVFANDLIINQNTPLDDEQRINLTAQCGGENDVRIRFRFAGTYYYWMLDDIQLADLDNNNMFNEYSTYGDFDFEDPGNPTGFEWLEYSQYPDEMAPLLKFTTFAENFGALVQTDVSLHLEIKDLNSSLEIHDDTSDETFNVQPGNEVELRVGNYQMPATISQYQLRFEVTQNENEEAPDDNNDTLNFRITDSVYARDHGFAQSVFVPLEDFNNAPYEVGNIFVITENGISAHSVTVGVSIGTIAPAPIYASIYEFSLDSIVNVTLLGTTSAVTVTEDDLNNYGDEHLLVLPFASPISLTNGHAYLVVAGSEDGPGTVWFSMSGDSPALSSWVWFEGDSWFYLPEMPMVRLNTGPFVSVEELKQENTSLFCWPSPAADFVNISFDMLQPQETYYEVFDITGSKITDGIFATKTGRNQMQLDTQSFSQGMYTIRIYGDALSSTGNFEVLR